MYSRHRKMTIPALKLRLDLSENLCSLYFQLKTCLMDETCKLLNLYFIQELNETFSHRSHWKYPQLQCNHCASCVPPLCFLFEAF